VSAVSGLSLPYLATCLAVVASPGPTFAVVLRQTLRQGRPAALVTVLGNTTGLVFWAAASVFGVAALVRASEVAFVALKVAGAGYLCWLGVQSLRRSRRRDGPGPLDAPDRDRSGLAAAFRAGLLTNVTNPKSAALYLALLPQFLPAHGNVLAGTAVLAGAQMLLSTCWFALLVLLIAAVRRLLTRPAVWSRLEQLSGGVLLALGVRLATLSRAAVA
jgi:threonine/homoserine/homoserine lactone efflux protein